MITTKGLRAAWKGKDRWLSDGGSRNTGRLVARIRRTGVIFTYQYFGSDRKRHLFSLGRYDPDGVRGLSLPVARDRAAELTALHRSGVTDLHAHFEDKRCEKERAHRAASEAALRAQEEAKRGTLQQLLEAYAAHLDRSRKSSAGDARNIFKNHVLDAAPDLVCRKAAEVSVDDFVQLIGALVEKGKGRTSAKLRSYLRSAYALAIRSKTDPAAPQVMRSFGIVVNPLASISALSQFNRTRTRYLNAPELDAFLKRLDGEPPGPKKDALQLCLWLGGQRPTQLLRVREADIDLSGGTVTLYDPKGARTQPRSHVLPLPAFAAEIVERRLQAVRAAREEACREGGDGDEHEEPGTTWLFSTDNRTAMRKETLSELVRNISTEMVKSGKAREPFQLRDLRRTVETLLAKLGTAPNVRGEVQSHGLGGVQKRHYDQHDYLAEKLEVLEIWETYLGNLKAAVSTERSTN